METKTYYLPTSENWDTVFWSDEPICIDREEAERLLYEWHGLPGDNTDVAFDELWREATDEEIDEYGKYDS